MMEYDVREPWTKHTNGHAVRFFPGNDILVVTFDHLQAVYDAAGEIEPWGMKFAAKNGWSLLGVVSKKHVWFREEELHELLESIRDSGLFSKFRRVVFAGGSKGGYGALAFSSLCPESTVIAINPQSTLDINLVPWEKRYPVRRWVGKYKDAAEELRSANQVFLLYDPYCLPDVRHAERLRGSNVTELHCRYLGHGIATCFQRMGILQHVMKEAILGTLTEQDFWKIYRARRNSKRYWRNLVLRAIDRGHHKMAEMVCRTRGSQDEDAVFFRMRLAMLIAADGRLDESCKILESCDNIKMKDIW